MSYHDRTAVSSKGVLQQPGELAVAVVDVVRSVAGAEGVDAVS